MNALDALLIALQLIIVHGPDDQLIEINISHISNLRAPRKNEGHFHKDVRCLIFLTSGQFVAVIEDCETVVKRIMQPERNNR